MAMTPNEQLEIVSAYVAGETIQYQGCYDSKWCADSVCGPDYEFDFQHLNYRKKPKPLERWLNLCADPQDDQVYETKEIARMAACKHCRTVHMREVVDD